MPRLQGKRALITGEPVGSDSKPLADSLEEGARVAITGLSKAGLDAARKELGDVIVIEADAGDVADQHKLAEEIRKAFRKLDVLFINAGIVELKPIGGFPPEGLDSQLRSRMLSCFSPPMRRRLRSVQRC